MDKPNRLIKKYTRTYGSLAPTVGTKVPRLRMRLRLTYKRKMF